MAYYNVVIVGLIEDEGQIISDGSAEIQYFDAETDELIKTEEIKETGILATLPFPTKKEVEIC